NNAQNRSAQKGASGVLPAGIGSDRHGRPTCGFCAERFSPLTCLTRLTEPSASRRMPNDGAPWHLQMILALGAAPTEQCRYLLHKSDENGLRRPGPIACDYGLSPGKDM